MKARYSAGSTFNEAMGAGSSPRVHRFVGKAPTEPDIRTEGGRRYHAGVKNWDSALSIAANRALNAARAAFPGVVIRPSNDPGQGATLHASGNLSVVLIVTK